MEHTTEPFKTWAIVELMGHVRLAGLVSEENRFGTVMGRIDIPKSPDTFVTQYFGGSSIYRVTPCDEATARAMRQESSPVQPWMLDLKEDKEEEQNFFDEVDAEEMDPDGVEIPY